MILAELAVLIALWWGADRLVTWLHVPLPGAVLGLLLLLGLFALGWVKPDRLRRGSALLSRHMLLFFLPPTLVLRAHPEMLGWVGLKLLLIILLGTLAVMGVTGLCVRHLLRHER